MSFNIFVQCTLVLLEACAQWPAAPHKHADQTKRLLRTGYMVAASAEVKSTIEAIITKKKQKKKLNFWRALRGLMTRIYENEICSFCFSIKVFLQHFQSIFRESAIEKMRTIHPEEQLIVSKHFFILSCSESVTIYQKDQSVNLPVTNLNTYQFTGTSICRHDNWPTRQLADMTIGRHDNVSIRQFADTSIGRQVLVDRYRNMGNTHIFSLALSKLQSGVP